MVRAYRMRLASSLQQPCFSMRLRRYVRNSRFSSMYVTADINGHRMILVWSWKKLIWKNKRIIDYVTHSRADETIWSDLFTLWTSCFKKNCSILKEGSDHCYLNICTALDSGNLSIKSQWQTCYRLPTNSIFTINQRCPPLAVVQPPAVE